MTFLLILYFGFLSLLCVYGVQRAWLLWRLRFIRHSQKTSHTPAWSTPHIEPLPFVTVQLPLYNEPQVVERLLRAVRQLDYPWTRLEVQVLDDSTDETTSRAAACVKTFQAEGFPILYVHRTERAGFKAGALAFGLKQAIGELVAIFDADFVPPADFLRQVVGHFVDPRVGMVQARWTHLNPEMSLLTRIQAILLDAHFELEHASRHAAGHFFNFNGTAGIWRRATIDDARGWQHDTLTEDLDLSYRAQLAGWRFVYRGDVTCPAELPTSMEAFKLQQRRWAQGGIQVGFKLLPHLLRQPLPMGTRRDAFFHLSGALSYPLMVGVVWLMPLAVWLRAESTYNLLWLDVAILGLGVGSTVLFYAAAQHASPLSWPTRIWRIVPLMALGAGMALNNSVGVWRALRRRPSSFERTPKHGRVDLTQAGLEVLSAPPLEVELRVSQPVRWRTYPLELLTAIWLFGGWLSAGWHGRLGALPFLSIFLAGYLWVGFYSWRDMQRHAAVKSSAQQPLQGLLPE